MEQEHPYIIEARRHVKVAAERMKEQAIRDPVYVPVSVVINLLRLIDNESGNRQDSL